MCSLAPRRVLVLIQVGSLTLAEPSTRPHGGKMKGVGVDGVKARDAGLALNRLPNPRIFAAT